ncbi:hypothetical protein EA772_15275 [Pedobacter sp. G11]|uniref:hypothetical protein n=1 Tax=Pedobacter sp. G11 TaxID=2482728 RepID=UPI000F5FA823|nr:hypothetical protein [Pedobacter sp. G11]AZI26636.1 hypothetical protein EA772_15275 [Pedobacter sp. G11]
MMKSENTFGLESESQPTRLSKGQSKSKIKFVRIGRQSTLSDLANVKLGTYIKSDSDLKGKVLQIDIVEIRHERHYYYRLEKGAGTILIIR